MQESFFCRIFKHAIPSVFEQGTINEINGGINLGQPSSTTNTQFTDVTSMSTVEIPFSTESDDTPLSADNTNMYQENFDSLLDDHSYCLMLGNPNDHSYCKLNSNVQNERSNESEISNTPEMGKKSTIIQAITPRKRKLKNHINRLKVKNHRLNKKLQDLTFKLTEKFKNTRSLAETIKIANATSGDLYKINKYKRKTQKYSALEKEFALSLYFCSPKAYRFCRQIFPLPCKRTIQIWLAKINIDTGFNSTLLNILEEKVKKFSEADKTCSILLDEMSIKASVKYDIHEDKVLGLENFGEFGKGDEVGNNALVIMVKGICRKWKQPLAYFISHNATPADMLKTIVTSAINHLFRIGLHPTVVVCDQGSTNQQMFKLFNITPTKPFIEINENKIFLCTTLRIRGLHGPDFVGPARPVDLTARPGPRARIEFRARPVSVRCMAKPGPARQKQFPWDFLKLFNTMINSMKHCLFNGFVCYL